MRKAAKPSAGGGESTAAASGQRWASRFELRAWIEHEEAEIWVGWAHHSGAGSVSFDDREYQFETGSGPASVRASFSEPGEYVIRMQTIDDIAAFEFYCCHTNAWFHVTVDE